MVVSLDCVWAYTQLAAAFLCSCAGMFVVLSLKKNTELDAKM